MERVWDQGGEAAAALARAVEGFGPQVLGRADLLTGLLEDDVPHLPREVALLTAAARSRVSELIAERIRHGLPPDQAVAMATAEMTSRTAMDASGARWAVGQYAHVLGHPVEVADTMPAPAHAESPTMPVPVPAQPGAEQPTEPPAAEPQAADAASRGQARKVGVAIAVGSAVVAPLSLLPFARAHGTVLALESAVLIAGLATTAIWAAIARASGGLAAALGLWIPLATLAIYHRAGAPRLFTRSERGLLEATSAIWLFTALTVAWLAAAGLAAGRHLARYKVGPMAVVTVVAGVAFAFANIAAQVGPQSATSENVLGADVHNRRILWGLMFLALVCLPPLLGLLLPRPGALPAMWTGWLAFGLAWQIANLPGRGHTPAPGMYLTWALWVVVLLGTAVMADRARVAARARPRLFPRD